MSIIFVGLGNFLGLALVGNYAFFWARARLRALGFVLWLRALGSVLWVPCSRFNVTAGLKAIKWFCLNIIDACREPFQAESRTRDY